MDLLENLAQLMGVECLSDLKYQESWTGALRELPAAERFSMREWNDAVSYLTGTHRTFQSPEEARNFLLHYQD